MSARRHIMLALAAWTLVAAFLVFWQYRSDTRETELLARAEAGASLRKDILYRSWAASQGGFYVPPTDATPPNPYLAGFPDRDVVTTSGKRLTLVNPAYMNRMVNELGRERFGLISHIASLRPINPANAPDPWERAALAAFEKGEAEVGSVEPVGGKPHMRLMRPLVTEPGCLKCHEAEGYKVGDVRGGIGVSLPMEPFHAFGMSNLRNDLLTAGLLWLVGAAVILAGGARTGRDLDRLVESEKALRQERDRAQGYLDTVEAIIVALDAEGRVTRINRKGCQLLGRSEEDLAGRNWFAECLPQPEGMEKVYPNFLKLVQGEIDPVEYFENPIVSGTGEIREIAWHNALLRDEKGRIAGTLSAGEDITERKRSEEALRESEKRFRGIFDTASDGILIANVATKTFVEANAAICEMLGYTPEELLRLGVEEIHPAADLPHVLKEFTRHGQGPPRVSENLPVMRKDGSVFYADVGGNRFDFGGEQYQIGIFRDITDRKRAEDALRLSEDKFRVLSDQSPMGMSMIDGQGRYEYVNAAFSAIFGYTLQDLPTGAEWFRAAFPDPAKRKEIVGVWKEDLARVGTGESNPRVFEVTCKGGARKTILFRPVSLQGNRQIVIYEDITERRQMESQLQQAMKMEAVGRLAGGIAHDFNNLLTVIIGNVSLALGKVPPSAPIVGMLSEVNKAAERAARLTQQLLAFSRKQIVEPKEIDLNALIVDLHTMLVRLIGEHIELATVPGEGLGTVKVDPGQMEQILVNLAVNARDAMRDGGKLRIETSNAELDDAYCAAHPDAGPGRFVLLTVSDTGHGMTDEVKAQIFEPFFTTKPKGIGTGLGLSMTHGAVKQTGGSIAVSSGEGKGTTVRIYLPRVEAEGEKAEEREPPQELLDATETVLLVEDEDNVRDLCVQVLERLGYKVIQAGNGAEAIAVGQGYGGRIDLLLTDVVMPGMNGSELAMQLVLLHPEAKVLFTSGYTENAIVHHGVLDEGVSFIGKPYTPSALARKIRDVLDRR